MRSAPARNAPFVMLPQAAFRFDVCFFASKSANGKERPGPAHFRLTSIFRNVTVSPASVSCAFRSTHVRQPVPSIFRPTLRGRDISRRWVRIWLRRGPGEKVTPMNAPLGTSSRISSPDATGLFVTLRANAASQPIAAQI